MMAAAEHSAAAFSCWLPKLHAAGIADGARQILPAVEQARLQGIALLTRFACGSNVGGWV
jgi:hypothetical protein